MLANMWRRINLAHVSCCMHLQTADCMTARYIGQGTDGPRSEDMHTRTFMDGLVRLACKQSTAGLRTGTPKGPNRHCLKGVRGCGGGG